VPGQEVKVSMQNKEILKALQLSIFTDNRTIEKEAIVAELERLVKQSNSLEGLFTVK
jgi:hypothetical protein